MEYHVPLDPHRHLRAAARERAERTVARLEAGIRAVEGRRELVTARAIERETGLTFKTIQRNAAAYELYKAAAEAFRSGPNPSHRRRHRRSNVTTPPLRDSLLAYKKPQLANRLRGPEADRGTGDCVGGPDRRLPGAARANHHGHYRRRGAIGKCDEHPPTDPRRRPVAVSTVNVQRPASVNSGDFGVIRLMEAAWLRLGRPAAVAVEERANRWDRRHARPPSTLSRDHFLIARTVRYAPTAIPSKPIGAPAMHASTAAGMRLTRESHQPSTFPSLTSLDPESHVTVPTRLRRFGRVSRCSTHPHGRGG